MTDYFKKVAETLDNLRKVHEELNTHLYEYAEDRPTIQSPTNVVLVALPMLSNIEHEEFWVFLLDTRNRLMRCVQLYKGSANSALIRGAEVFREAIIMNAVAIILVHNHPSGNAEPSPDDLAMTKSLVKAGKLLQIDVLDHIIIAIADDEYISIKSKFPGVFNVDH